MTITALPSRAALDLGAALTNARAPVANELSAVNVEKIKDWIISLASEVGLSDGSTAGSLREALLTFAIGALDGLRLAEQAGDPSATANEAKVYALDLAGTTHIFSILSDGTIIRLSGTSTAPASLGRAASAGSLGSMANADHVHDEGVLVAPTSMSSNTTLTAAMQVLLIDTTSGALNLTLPTPVSSSPRHWLLKKINAGASDITLVRGGSENIEGSGASLKLPQSESLERPSWTLVRDNSGNFWVL